MDALNAYLADHSYLGGDSCATLVDYQRCGEIRAADIDKAKMPHLHRWHTHVSHLMSASAKFDYLGRPVPAGTAPSIGASPSQAQPKKEAQPRTETQPKKEAQAKKEAQPKKQPQPKKEAKAKGGDKAEAEEEKQLSPEELEKQRKDLMKKVTKEGGKRGVEIEGAADMGGLQFFCTSVDLPAGDLELLVMSMTAMNAKSDPTEEERKGGSGHIGKMIFSAGVEQLAIVAYVPEGKQSECNCEEWLRAVVSSQGGEVLSVAKDVCTGRVATDSDKGVFPLKIREPMILEANNFLRKKGLFPEDDDDDDEYVFGDDDFPS